MILDGVVLPRDDARHGRRVRGAVVRNARILEASKRQIGEAPGDDDRNARKHERIYCRHHSRAEPGEAEVEREHQHERQQEGQRQRPEIPPEHSGQNAADRLEHRTLAVQGRDFDDWEFGITLVHEDHIEEYAEEYLKEVFNFGDLPEWIILHIDWEAVAEELFQDWSQVEFEGSTYYIQ